MPFNQFTTYMRKEIKSVMDQILQVSLSPKISNPFGQKNIKGWSSPKGLSQGSNSSPPSP